MICCFSAPKSFSRPTWDSSVRASSRATVYKRLHALLYALLPSTKFFVFSKNYDTIIHKFRRSSSVSKVLVKNFGCPTSCTKVLVRRTKNLKQHWDGCRRCSRPIRTKWNWFPKFFKEHFVGDVCSATAPTIYKQPPALPPLSFYLDPSSCSTRKHARVHVMGRSLRPSPGLH